MAHTDYVQVTDIAFLEFSGSQPRSLLKLFKQMGFVQAGRHVDRPITLHTQGHIHFISNPSSGGNAELFRAVHYRGACAGGAGVLGCESVYECRWVFGSGLCQCDVSCRNVIFNRLDQCLHGLFLGIGTD